MLPPCLSIKRRDGRSSDSTDSDLTPERVSLVCLLATLYPVTREALVPLPIAVSSFFSISPRPYRFARARCHRRETPTTSSRGIGSSSRPASRPSTRSRPTAASWAGASSYARPVSQPSRESWQSKGRRSATPSQQPQSCMRDTALSRMR